MKTKKIIKSILFTVACVSTFSSCDQKEVTLTNPEISTGVYVLNQGAFGINNAGMSYYDLTTSTATSDVFTVKNNRGLGDTGQDMIKYGSKIYIAVSKSSLIEILDAKTGISMKTIPMLNALSQPSSPRSLASYNGKVYISLYDGHVARLDTSTLTIEKTIQVGSNPEGITIANNKIYVANSGGMSAVPDSTISVIDLATFTELRKIKVVIDPVVLKSDAYGDLYVISMGNYSTIPYSFQRVEAATTEKVTAIADVKAYNLTIDGDNAYIYNYEYDANYNVVNKTYSIYDVKNEKVLKANFIASTDVAKTPYSIDVNPLTKDIFIGETDFKNTGKMYCFAPDGTFKYSFPTGVNPVKTVFMSNK